MKLYEAEEFNNIKEIIYNSAEKFNDKPAFRIKKKEEDKTTYTDISYEQFLEDINALGTALYSLNLKNKRIAV